VLTVLTGLLSSLSYATSDMFSQRVTRETRALTQMVWVMATGTAVSLPVALLVRGVPHGGEWSGAGLSALAGVLYVFALFCLYRGLNVGDLGLISALISLMGAYVAVVVIVLGAPVTLLLVVALVMCVCGGVLASFEGRAGTTRGAAWGLAGGLLFAALALCFNYADIDWLSQVAISRTVSLVAVLPVALLSGSISVPRRLRPVAAGAGLLELAGLALFTITFALGPATVAGVTTTQIGTCAVILGFVVLRERPKPNQWAGIVCTLAGVSLLAVAV
jgi:drug/metabolite transporter (DMT)-like permease